MPRSYRRKVSLRGKKSKKRSLRRKSTRQRGGKIVLPAQHFNPNAAGNYQENMSKNTSGNVAVSHGVVHGEVAGPDLNLTGGGPLPAEYYGNDSGRYFEAGAPELQPCNSPYGMMHPTSHGVVLDAPGDAAFDAAGEWMGPNLSPYPLGRDMTGGRRKKSRRSKSKRSKSKRSKSIRRKSKRSKSKRGNKKRN